MRLADGNKLYLTGVSTGTNRSTLYPLSNIGQIFFQIAQHTVKYSKSVDR
jgi:hypothetical protein